MYLRWEIEELEITKLRKKDIMESMKESAANVAASARAGMEKTKATAQEKMEKAAAHDPLTRKIAEEKKHVKTHEAELNKQEAREHNAAMRQAATGTGTHGIHPTHTTGTHGIHSTHVPGTGGVVGAHPTETGTARTTTTHHPHVGDTRYSTGGA